MASLHPDTESNYRDASAVLRNARRAVAFTGAGISVESGIPPFRGEGGLWSTYDPVILDITYFRRNPLRSWQAIKEIFYDYFGSAEPNTAHGVLADWEARGLIDAVITQNIDHLHQRAGSRNVLEFHGTSEYLVCDQCGEKCTALEADLRHLPPRCPGCGDILRPDFVFFGEPIPEPANSRSFGEAEIADVFLLIGTTGEIMPASLIPQVAKEHGASIIEINPDTTAFTNTIVDIHLPDTATVAMEHLDALVADIGQ